MLNSNQILLLKEYRDPINEIGRDMEEVVTTFLKKIHAVKEYRFLLTILMGPEIIKTELKGLAILHDYIIELEKIVKSGGNCIVKKSKNYDLVPLGGMVRIVSDKYSLEKNNNKLYLDLFELKDKRNDIAHQAVITYKGDIEKVDEFIKLYILKQPMDSILKGLIGVFNKKREENSEIANKIKELGLL